MNENRAQLEAELAKIKAAIAAQNFEEFAQFLLAF